jgi:hypothetical protein
MPRPPAVASSRGAALALTAALTAGALLFGCTRDARDPSKPPEEDSPPAAAARKEKRVYEVASAKDLLDVQSAYLKAAAGGGGVFEVRFSAAIPATSWSLAPEPGKGVPALDLVLIGQGGAIPAPGKLVARSVRLENLVLTGPVGLSSEIEVRTGFTMVDAGVIDGRGTVPASQAPYLAIRAHGVRGKKEPATLTIERSWFIRNWQADQSLHGAVLLGLEQDGRDGGHFGEVRIRDCVFSNNAFATELRLAYARDVAIERTLFYKTWPSGLLIDADTVEKVRLVDSILVADDLAHVARLGKDVAPIEATGTKLFIRSYTDKAALPAALKIDRAAVASRAPIDAKAAPLDAAGRIPAALPKPELRAELMKVFAP